MTLKRGNETVELTNEIQIVAYKNSGFVEVKPPPKGRGKNGDTSPDASSLSGRNTVVVGCQLHNLTLTGDTFIANIMV